MLQASYWRIALLSVVVASVFFVELGAARLWDRDEPRNARASHEMLARGDWIVPTFNGSLRDHKPILLYWGQMLGYQWWGESEFTARLPSAVASVLAILAVAFLTSRLSGKPRGISHEGFWAAGCLASCMLFVMAGRAATPDACLIAFSTLGVASLVSSALLAAPPYSSGRVGRARWVPALFGYTMLGLAALAKGPVGILLPLSVVHVWWLICWRLQTAEIAQRREPPGKRWRFLRSTGGLAPFRFQNSTGGLAPFRFQGRWHWEIAAWLGRAALELWRTFHPLACLRAIWSLRAIPGVALSLLAAAPWYVAVGMQTQGAFLRGFFLEHNLGRAMGAMEGHQGGLLFYPLAFLAGTFPWSMWLIPVVLWCRQAARENVVQRQMVVLAAVWIGIYLTAFSLASTKLPSYITPCYAGAALALGGFWRQFENGWSRPSWSMRQVAGGLTVLVGLSILGGLWWLSYQQAMPRLAWTAAAGGVIVTMGLAGLWLETRHRPHRVPLAWLVGAAGFQLILFGYGPQSVDVYRQDLAALHSAAERIAARPAAQAAPQWLAIGGMEPSWVHYLQTPIEEVLTPANDPQSWEQVAEFLQRFPQGRVILVGQEAQAQFAQQQHRLGSREWVELSSAPRFLRPGKLSVVAAASPLDNSAAQQRLSHVPAAARR